MRRVPVLLDAVALALTLTLAPGTARAATAPRVDSTERGDRAERVDDAPRPSAPPTEMRVALEPLDVEGELAAPDRVAILAALRRGLSSPGYTVIGEPERCTNRRCRQAAASEYERVHRIGLRVVAGPRTYEVELRAYRPGQDTAYATASGRCEICGVAELEQLVLSKADAISRRLASGELASASLAVTSVPLGADVLLDGEMVGTTPYEAAVAPGVHRVELMRNGYRPASMRVDATGGVRERVHAVLDATDTRSPRKVIGVVALGVGVAALAGGVTMLALDGREVGRRCGGDANRDLDGDCRWVHRTLGGGIAMTIGGSVLAATGVTLLVLDRRQAKARRYALSGTIGPQRVGLTLAF